jgi:branched-chain amino acid transport system substrate-binding protein
MRRSRRLPAVIALAVLAVLVLGACAEDKGGGTPEAAEVADTPVAGNPGAETPAAEVPGVTDTEILLGTHFPLSQHLAAAYATIATAGMKGYFDYINDQGGIHGRKIRLLIGDDHYSPQDAAEVTRKLVEQDRVFAIVGALGTTPHSAVWKYLEERGVPDMFMLTGATKWTDPVVRTRFGGNVDYFTEAKILGRYIAEEQPEGKLCMILQNDDFGFDGEKGLLAGIESSGVEVVGRETYESVEADMTAYVQRCRNAGATVVAAYALPPQAANAVKVAREVLDWDVPIVVTGADAIDAFILLAGAENAEGVVSAVFAPPNLDRENPAIQRHIEIMERYGGGATPGNPTIAGQLFAELMVEILERAGPDLTRDSFLDAAESLRGFQCSLCLVPVSLSPTDHRPFEIELYARVENGEWVTFGEPVNFESTPG